MEYTKVDAFCDQDGFGVSFGDINSLVYRDEMHGTTMQINSVPAPVENPVPKPEPVESVYLSVDGGDKDVYVNLRGALHISRLRMGDTEAIVENGKAQKEISFSKGSLNVKFMEDNTVSTMTTECDGGLIYCGEQLEDRG